MVEGRHQFDLCEFDEVFMKTLGLSWETVIDANKRWLLLHGYSVGEGYNKSNVSVGIELPPTYPDTQIDMVYFFPHIARMDGQPIAKLTDQAFDGKVWQRWSRHRTATNPWRREYDCVETHLLLVDEWLEREIRRAA